MAKGNETTTKFKVDISELKKAMQDAKRSVAVANSEFKEASSSMEDWSKSSDGISAKLKQLNSNLKSQKSVLAEYEKTLEEVKKEYGENSNEAREYATKLNNQKAVVNKIQKEINGYEDALNEVTEAEKKSAKTGKSVADILDDVGDGAKDAEGGFTTLKGAIATFAGNALTGLANGLKDAVSSLFNLADETREYRTELAKLETAAKQSGASTDFIKNKWKDLGSVLGDEGAITEGLNNLVTAGFTTEKEMNAITGYLEGAAIKWKDTLKFEGLADGLQETLATGAAVGPFAELLERSGVNLEKFDKGLGKCKTSADQQNYVLQQLSKLGLNEVSESYREQNKDLIEANKANANYTDTMATLGKKVEPVTTAVKNGFNELLQKALELVGDVDMSKFTAKVEEGFKVLKDDVLPAVKDGLGWILDNKDAIIAGLAAIASGFVAFKVVTIIQGLVTAFNAWRIATEGMTIAQRLLNIAMSMNPIGIIISLIAALVAAFIVLWNKSDKFREFWINLWEKIKSGTKKVVDSVGKFFTETIPNFFKKLIDWIKDNWDTILVFLMNPFAGLFKYFYENNSKFKEFVDNAIKAIKELPSKIAEFFNKIPYYIGYAIGAALGKILSWGVNLYNFAKTEIPKFINKVVEFFKQLPSKVWTWLVNTVTKIATWGSNMVTKGKQAATNFINSVINFIKNLPSKVWSFLTQTVSKVVTWGTNLASKGKEAAKKLFDSIVNKIKNLPSELKSMGKDIVKGLWNGINDMTSWIANKIKGFGKGVTDGLKKFFKIKSPSRLMAEEVGRYLPEGIALGIDKNAKSVMNSMRNLATNTVGAARSGLSAGGTTGTVRGGVVNNFTQVINSPKQLSRADIYRQSNNLLGYAGGV